MLQSNAQRLQDELLKFGNIVKQHEDNLTFLKAQEKQLHDSIVGLQVRLDKYHSSSTIKTENDERSSAQIDKETIDQIMKHGNSAAGILCEMQVHKSLWSFSLSLIEDDVIGIVATLGRVDDDKLSRLLSEYLGLDTMLAIVCKSYDGVKSLEAYDKEGRVRKDCGIHLFGSNQGKVLEGRFQVMCLEKLRPYSGSFVADDPQKRLDMTKPTDRNGEIPAGFIGFAVNLIKVDIHHLYCLTANGCGIRETLFYNLFSRLQVYRTRSDMFNALPCITDGAISLDGGMIRSKGVFSLGRREDLDVRFPIKKLDVPLEIFEIKKQMKQKEWEKERLNEDMQREQLILDQGKDNFQKKKQELVNLLAERSRCVKQSINEGAHPEDVHPEVTLLKEETCAPLPDTEVGNSPSSNPVDYSSDFKTDEVWPDRESLLEWAREVASKKNMVLTIQKSWLSKRSQYGKVFLTCERYGNYRAAKNSEQSEEVELSRAKKSKKSGCTFALCGREFKRDQWRLEVECGFHNHELSPSSEGHVFVGWLTEKEYSAVKKLSASGSKPKKKLEGSPTDVTSIKQMYNARWRMKKEEFDGHDRGTRVLQDLGG